MPEIPIELEVERVMNLVRGFGWEKKEQRMSDNSVVLVIEKKVEVPVK
ncbi:hypothetical protein LCGC14_3038970, partial [marine sediment metagenome]